MNFDNPIININTYRGLPHLGNYFEYGYGNQRQENFRNDIERHPRVVETGWSQTGILSRINSDDAWIHQTYAGPRNVTAGRSVTGANKGAKLILSNLHFAVTDRDLERLFADFGRIRKAVVHYDRTGKSLGTAHVIFERRSDAIQVMEQRNGFCINGRVLNIELTTAETPSLVERVGDEGRKFQNKRQLGGICQLTEDIQRAVERIADDTRVTFQNNRRLVGKRRSDKDIPRSAKRVFDGNRITFQNQQPMEDEDQSINDISRAVERITDGNRVTFRNIRPLNIDIPGAVERSIDGNRVTFQNNRWLGGKLRSNKDVPRPTKRIFDGNRITLQYQRPVEVEDRSINDERVSVSHSNVQNRRTLPAEESQDIRNPVGGLNDEYSKLTNRSPLLRTDQSTKDKHESNKLPAIKEEPDTDLEGYFEYFEEMVTNVKME